MPKTIYLLRHGEVEPAYRGRARGGGTDCGLSEIGEQMSLANIEFLIAHDVRHLVTSGMRRTEFVAAAMKRRATVDHRSDPRLKEMHLGPWENRLWKELVERHPREADALLTCPAGISIPGAEDPEIFRQRVMTAWAEIIRVDCEKIAVVTHGIVNALILSHITDGVTPEQGIGCMNEITTGPPPRIIRENVILYPSTLTGLRNT